MICGYRSFEKYATFTVTAREIKPDSIRIRAHENRTPTNEVQCILFLHYKFALSNDTSNARFVQIKSVQKSSVNVIPPELPVSTLCQEPMVISVVQNVLAFGVPVGKLN
jgi:hypothetical protein